MLVATYYSNSDIRLEERSLPQLGKGESLLKIHASGICGSDLMEWYRRDKVPLILGHEVAGEIVEVRDAVTDFTVGDRVVASHHVPCLECRYCLRGYETMCRTLKSTDFDPGGFSQYVRMPEINTKLGLYKIPKEISYEEASFTEPLACVLRGQCRASLQQGDVVAVIGSGMSGVLHIALAKATGAEMIIASDINEKKLPWAEKFGADLVTRNSNEIATILEGKTGQKADIVILTTGHPEAVLAGFSAAEDGGTILLFAPSDPETTVPIDISRHFFKRDITVTTTYAGSLDDHREALQLIAEKMAPVKEMITHRIGLKEIQSGFDLVKRGTDSLKVMVEPQKE